MIETGFSTLLLPVYVVCYYDTSRNLDTNNETSDHHLACIEVQAFALLHLSPDMTLG